jgi:hypothetical protein
MYKFISIGGWCGTRIALDQLKITREPHNIFDHVRSSSKGIIDCIQNDFANYLPENKTIDARFGRFARLNRWTPFIGEHFGFFYSASLTDKDVLDSFDRKIQRFYDYCNSNDKLIFVRTCVIPDYESELNDMKILYQVIKEKYPKLLFKIAFVIPDQDITQYYDNIDGNIYIFCLNDKSYKTGNLGKEYRNIYKFIYESNLFETVSPPNTDIQITTPTKRLCLIDNIPVINSFEHFREPR